MIEYRSEPGDGSPSEFQEHPGDATGELRAGASVLPERLRLAARSRAARAASVLVVAAAAVTAVLVSRHDGGGGGGGDALPPVDPASTGRLSAMDDVSALTRPGRFTTAVRQSSAAHPCPVVATGADPTATVAAAVGHVSAGTHVIGVTRTVDQFHGLCALTVALVGAADQRFTVSVTAPTTIGGASAAVRPVPRPERIDGLVEYAVVGWRSGWWLLVGVVGYPGEVADPNQLSAVANSPDLLW